MPKDAEQLMSDLNSAFVAGLEAGDVEQIVSLYAENGVYLPADHPPVNGIEFIADFFRDSISRRSKQEPTWIKWSPVQTIAAGDLVLQWGTYSVNQGSRKDPVVVAGGSQLLVARKKSDGSLELLWDIDNINSVTR